MFHALSWLLVVALLALWSLAPWVPPEVAHWASPLMAGFAPFVGGLTVATWVILGIGSVLLVLLGAGLHLLIAPWRSRGGRTSGPRAGPSLAAG